MDAEAEAQAKNPQAPTSPPKAPAGARPSGKPSRARRTTSPPVFDGTIIPQVDQIGKKNAEFEARIAKMEAGQAQLAKGVDKLVELLAARDHVAEKCAGFATREEVAVQGDDRPAAHDEAGINPFEPDDDLDEVDDDAALIENQSLDPFEPGDPNIARMQAFIQRRTPLKDFRRFWQGLCPRAGFQEWPAEMQTKFTGIFNTIILHPRFLAQVRRTVLTFHNGNCMGEEQMYKMLVMLAGNCALYSIITAEV